MKTEFADSNWLISEYSVIWNVVSGNTRGILPSVIVIIRGTTKDTLVIM